MFSASKTAAVSGSYQIANSLRFRSSASAYLNRTPSVAGNQKTWTWSGWIKIGEISDSITYEIFSGDNGSTSFTGIRIINNTIYVQDYLVSTKNIWWQTAAVFRDPSAWYHIVVKYDTTQASSTSSVLVYVNGVSQSLTFTAATGAYVQNYNGIVNSTYSQKIANKSTLYFDGYMAEVNFIDGQALTPSLFGQINPITGVWQPIAYAGTYGTNGFYLNFNNGTSTTTLGYDSSANGNNWTTNNISLTTGSTYDWMIDSPTSYAGTSYGVGNYAVLNPLAYTGATPINANLTQTTSSASTYIGSKSSFGISSGKWYWEQTMDSITSTSAANSQVSGGVCLLTYNLNAGSGSAGHWGFQNSNGAATFSWKMDNGTGTNTYTRIDSGDIVGIALDMDGGSLGVYRNNTLLFTCSNSLTGNTVFPMNLVYAGSGYTATSSMNFGQRPLAYTPPSGFKSLCTFNLPDPSIANGANYMAATLYTGNGSTQSISNAVNSVSFQPDFVWVKSRSGAGQHSLTDVVRGVNSQLFTNSTAAQGSETDQVTAFNTNGFSLGANIAGTGSVNVSAVTYVGWQWKAGGTAVTNTAGSITSSVSANTTAGFSVVTYTGNGAAGATVGHGLGVAPSFIIIKDRTAARTGDQWPTYHVSIGATGGLVYLNSTGAGIAASTVWNNTNPSSSVFTLGSWGGINYSSDAFVAYCFAAIPGYSAFGSYTGNGSADGPFVFTGFRPRYVLIKCSSTTASWVVRDTSRDLYNPELNALYPNLSDAEYTTATPWDYLANGFKLRTGTSGLNGSGETMIYIAFAENPFKYSLAR